MKVIAGIAAVLFLISVGYVAAQTNQELKHPTPSEEGSQGFVGRQVKIYFRKSDQIPFEHLSGGTLTWISGKLNTIDNSFVAVRGEDGDEILVPMASVAYIRSSGVGPTTAPN